MKKKDVIEFFKDCAEIFHHAPFCARWSLYDYIFTIYRKLFRKKYVGIYIKVMSPSERKLFFIKGNVGGGLCGFTIIKIFFERKWCTAETVAELVNHEVLHQVLRKHIGYKACRQLDRIHRCYHYVKRGTFRIWFIDFID